MKKAKEYFYNSIDTELISDKDNTYRISKGGLIDKALELAFYEGIRVATGLGLQECKIKYKQDSEYFHQFFDYQKYKRKNNLL